MRRRRSRGERGKRGLLGVTASSSISCSGSSSKRIYACNGHEVIYAK